MARDHSVSAADNFGGLARAIVRARRMIFSCCPVLGWTNLRVCIIHMAECQFPTRFGPLHREPGKAWHGELPIPMHESPFTTGPV